MKRLPLTPTHVRTWKKTKTAHGWIFLMATVLTRRVRVANDLHSKNNLQLIQFSQNCHDQIGAAAGLFSTPLVSLADLQTGIDNLTTTSNDALSGDHTKITLRNTAREELLNLMAGMAEYVEEVANDPAQAVVGPIVVIQMAGMIPQEFTPRQKQGFKVFRKENSGTLSGTAVAIEKGDTGIHKWARTKTPADPTSWIEMPDTFEAAFDLVDLTPADIWSIRHRVFSRKHGLSDWEVHEPVVIG